ncbi:hypothetical protein ACLIA0_14975 [Bacillaceae bacterium W0354]
MNELYLLGLFLLILVIFIILGLLVFNKLIILLLEKIGKSLAKIIIQKTKEKNIKKILYLIDIIYLLLLILSLFLLLIFIVNKNYNYFAIYILIYAIIIIVLATLYIEIKDKKLPKYTSIINKVMRVININTNTYIVSRIKIIIDKSSMSAFIHFLITYITIVSYTYFTRIPIQVQYFLLLAIPFSLNSWIYFTSCNAIEQRVRRIVAYGVILVITIWGYFIEYKSYAIYLIQDDALNYLIVFFIGIFIAVDRFLKSIVEDIRIYRDTGNKHNI